MVIAHINEHTTWTYIYPYTEHVWLKHLPLKFDNCVVLIAGDNVLAGGQLHRTVKIILLLLLVMTCWMKH